MDIELSPLERKALKARAHPLHPTVLIGDKGLTDAVLHEIDVHLKSHELIKVRVANAERMLREAMLTSICERLRAQAVQHIGRILVIFREKPAEPPPPRRPKAPRSAARKRTAAAHPRINAGRWAGAAPAKARARTR
jgi:RNA-binding protein